MLPSPEAETRRYLKPSTKVSSVDIQENVADEVNRPSEMSQLQSNSGSTIAGFRSLPTHSQHARPVVHARQVIEDSNPVAIRSHGREIDSSQTSISVALSLKIPAFFCRHSPATTLHHGEYDREPRHVGIEARHGIRASSLPLYVDRVSHGPSESLSEHTGETTGRLFNRKPNHVGRLQVQGDQTVHTTDTDAYDYRTCWVMKHDSRGYMQRIKLWLWHASCENILPYSVCVLKKSGLKIHFIVQLRCVKTKLSSSMTKF